MVLLFITIVVTIDSGKYLTRYLFSSERVADLTRSVESIFSFFLSSRVY